MDQKILENAKIWANNTYFDTIDRQEILNLLGNGASRLRGKKSAYSFSYSDDKAVVSHHYTETPHSEGQSGSGGYRSLDYSDNSMLKDYELYGYPSFLPTKTQQ